MFKAIACPVLQPINSVDAVSFEFAQKLEPKTQTATAFATDMICAVAFCDSGLPDTMAAIDAITGGGLARHVRDAGFTAAVGQQVVVDLHRLGAGQELPQYAMLIGLGEGLPVPGTRTPSETTTIIREALCAVTGAICKAALRLAVTELTVDFGGLAQHHVSISGMAALLRCRITHERAQKGLPVSRVTLICSPVESGSLRLLLAGENQQICSLCTEPCFASHAVIN